MIKVLLMGGVGNRLFQVAHAYSIMRRGQDVCLIELPERFELIAKVVGWSVHWQWFDVKKMANKFGVTVKKAGALDLATVLYVYLLRRIGILKFDFDRALEYTAKEKNGWSIGYFQSSAHVDKESVGEIASYIAKELNIEQGQYGTIHIRGGDFEIADRMLPEKIKEALDSDEKIRVVTNDLKYTTEVCNVPEERIMCGESALQDFKTLASSSYIYPSESTFSFWASRVVVRNGGKIKIETKSQMWNI